MVSRVKKFIPFLVVTLAGVVWVRAQTVAWNPPGPMGPNEASQLELVFTDCQPAGSVNLPSVAGLQILGQPGRATSFSMINFQTSSSTTLSYAVVPTQTGRIQIPSFEVATDKGKKTVPGLALDVAAASTANRRAPPAPAQNFPFPPGFFQNTPPTAPSPGGSAGAVQAAATVDPGRPFAGEVFDVNYRVVITGNRSGRVKTTPLWDVQNFSAEAWDRGQQIGPGGSQGLQFHTRAMVPKAGPFDLPPIRQKLDLDTALGGRSFFFTAPGSEEVEVSADAVGLQIQPLPGGAPAGFKGAVGQFVLESKMVPEQVNEGEPVTWTLTLRGTGNWPMGVELPARTVPNAMRTIQPKLRREFNGTDIFTGAVVEDLVLIPTQSGEYELPPVKFLYFDPKKKSYETAEVKPPRITVAKGGGGLSLSPTQPAASAGTSTGAREKNASPVGAQAKPAKPLDYGAPGLPQEPLEGTGFAMGPLPPGVVILISALPWVFLLWVWWGWIQTRAVQTDPWLPQKGALKDWQVCVRRIRQATSKEEIIQPLILWQQAVFKVLRIQTSLPRAKEIQKVKTEVLSQAQVEVLYRSYRTVEDALYGLETGVRIGDWCDEVSKIAEEAKFPSRSWRNIFALKNIWPWMGLWLLCLGSELWAQKTDPAAATEAPAKAENLYRDGRFEQAGQIWTEAIRKNSCDPKSRNNLALAWYQRGDKERALANGLSAYLLAPRTHSVDWNTRIFAAAADQLDPSIRSLFDGTWESWLTSRAGIFLWQVGLVVGSTATALGAGLWLAAGYDPKRKRIFLPLGVASLGLGLMILLASGTALGELNKLSDRNAVMIVDVEPLRSVPTEVEPQAEKAYPPGSIAHREKEFLGWSKLRMPNRDTGWIRTESIVPLY